jgi:hypothetical protein
MDNRRMGPRERALNAAKTAPGAPPGVITKPTLLKEIRNFKNYPSTIGMDTKKALLLNLLLGYVNDPEILREVWSSGIDSLGKTLEDQLKKGPLPQ